MTGGRIQRLHVEQLRLDPLNPRLPPGPRNQEELIRFIDGAYDPLTIARSIAEHGYFESEPLIAISEDDHFVVVEGNRRLVALKGLAEEETRRLLTEQDEWEALARKVQLPDDLPVVVAESRRDVAPIIGYRHISGIAPWEPFAKARFIGSLIDDDQLDFETVADIVGEDTTDVRSSYRNYRIAIEAKEKFGLDTDYVKEDFGVFTRAMTSISLRQHISAPSPAEVSKNQEPIPDDKADELLELFSWIFGDREGGGRVISDSRELTKLGRVIGSEEGLGVLRATGDLAAAEAAAGGTRNRLVSRLAAARTALRDAAIDMPQYRNDEEVLGLLEECSDALHELRDSDEDRD